MSAKLSVKSARWGKGVFALEPIAARAQILQFKGALLHSSELPEPYSEVDDHYLQVSAEHYLGPSGEADDYINHSCAPNAGIRFNGDKTYLIALRDIAIGEEICFDYSTTMDGDDWELECECGAKQCRRKVGEFRKLPKELQQYYLEAGMVPEYIRLNLLAHSDKNSTL